LLANIKNKTSLYLDMQKNSLVKWNSWTQETLLRAKREKKPIFLSIGYSTSYFCELMREESFNDNKIATLLNEKFISIKIDKDQMSDIESYFKQVYKLMNGQHCSSPISVFMTEDLEPFYTAGYIAPYPKGNVLGFYELLNVVLEKYKNDKETLKAKAQEVLSFLNPTNNKIQATKLHKDILNVIIKHYIETFDTINGGFGSEPKFLNSSLLDLLIDVYLLSEKRELLEMLETTLKNMANQEIFDSNEGGLFIYARNKDYSSVRREKLTYDNANIALVYLRAYEIVKNDLYRDVAFKTIDFLLEKMMSDDFLFYSNYLFKKDNSILIDKNIITSWNAMVIDTLFLASKIDSKYTKSAINSLEKLLEKRFINGTLYHTDLIEAFLEDYAYLGVALLSGYKITQNEEYLILSQTLLNRAIEKFYKYGKWKFSNNDFFDIYADIYDLTYPSSVATILYLIEKISPLVEGDYSEILFRSLEFNSYNLMRQPLSFPKMTKILLLYLKDDIIFKKQHRGEGNI
jgi:uncharacterized protein YyaL (SSP411 family)